MNNPLLRILFFTTITLFSFSFTLNAQSETEFQRVYNTKRNFISLSGNIGGGDYPFAGLGLMLSRQFFNGKTMIGIRAEYIGNTYYWEYIDPVQVFPVMLDVRQKFMESRDGRFSTFVIADAGYVVSITGNDVDEFGPYEYGNGWGVSPGIGFRFNIFENVGLMLDFQWFHHAHTKIWELDSKEKEWKHWNTGLVRGSVFF